MRQKKPKKDKKYGSVIVIFFMTLILGIVTLLFSFFGIESYQTSIANGTLESTLITVKNIFSVDGLRFIVGNAVSSLKNFEPLVYLIIALLGIGICEKSGFLQVLSKPFKKVKLSILIFITLLVGIVSTVLGDYGYVFLIPIIGVMYQSIGKSPILGILILYLGITLGYGTGIIFNYNDHLIGMMSQNAATLDVDKNYKYSLFSNIYFMIVSTGIMAFLSTIVVNKFLVPKLSIKYVVEEEEFVVSKKAMIATVFFAIAYIGFIIYMITPVKLPGAGILLDQDPTRYMDKLFGSQSPFGNGLVLIISFLLMLCGYIYGKVSGNIKNGSQFSLGLSKNFENLGFLFVLIFFVSQMLAIVNWSNLGQVIGTRLIEFMNNLQFSGIILIIVFFLIVVIMGILLPGTIDKWNLISPTIIPLFMRSNITPAFTQLIFKIADGIGKAITPFFTYFIVMLAFLEKYKTDEKHQISIFGTLKILLPSILLIGGIWLLLLVIWYIIGFPLGIGTYSTL